MEGIHRSKEGWSRRNR